LDALISNERKIVERIKSFRIERGLTLNKLAEMTGFTKGYISRIEKSPKAPPISTIAKIARGLNVEITDFFSSKGTLPLRDKKLSIAKAGQRMMIGARGTSSGYSYQALVYNKLGKSMDPYIVTLGFDKNGSIQHPGEEFFYILEGKMEFYYNGKSYLLEKGDFAYYDSDIPHTGRSVGGKRAKLLVSICSQKTLPI
jgi:transcriptional regulator with XRE-family HTH domain